MPRNKYPEETVDKILDTSLKLFLEKGYEQTTILDIVDNLGGLTRGAFYHHFKTKDDVLMAIFDKYYNENDPIEKVSSLEGLNGIQKLRMLLRITAVEGFVDEKKTAMDNISLPLMTSPRFLFEQVKGTRDVALMLIPIVTEGQKDGSISDKYNPKIIAELIMILFNHWMIPTIYPCNDEESEGKIFTIKKILDDLGVPLIDEELLNDLFKVKAFTYKEKKHE